MECLLIYNSITILNNSQRVRFKSAGGGLKHVFVKVTQLDNDLLTLDLLLKIGIGILYAFTYLFEAREMPVLLSRIYR
jgi:hypothetical protein